MELIDGFYVDSNNNKWDVQIYNEKTARKASKSLVNCVDCKNCVNCEIAQIVGIVLNVCIVTNV